VPVPLPEGLLDLLRQPSLCFVATVMPDGSPQLTETWVTTDGEHVQINIVDGMQKARNLARDPRVAVNVADPANPRRYYAVRGRAIEVTAEGGVESINAISRKYLGRDYPGFGSGPQTRLLVTIEADSVSRAGG
jgi:PPOX class probable F420-dependent enzyme